MAGIPKLSSKARVGEVGGAGENILQIRGDEGTSGDENLQNIFDLLATGTNQLIIAIEKDKAYSDLEEHDQRRDDSYRNLYNYVMACRFLPSFTEIGKVEELATLFEKYGLSIIYKSYVEQTAQLESLLKELAEERYVKMVAVMPHATTMVSNLRTAQEAFMLAHSDYISQLNQLKETQSASVLKPQVLHAINDQLVPYIYAMTNINPEIYGRIAGELTLEINKVNQIIKNRENKAEERKLEN